jgi:tRNA G37 N-methylase Trm5
MIDIEKIEWTTAELATIEFRPGDTAVLMFPQRLSMDQVQHISEHWTRTHPGIKCVVLDSGARLGVIREAVPA